MPYVKIQSSAPVAEHKKSALLSDVSKQLAGLLGKPEAYVMTAYQQADAMTFAGSNDPCAFLEVKSIGLPQSATASLSKALCELVSQYLKIPTNRIYIEFANASGAMWGWDGRTF
jgi:phenylpyruvate tautomerase